MSIGEHANLRDRDVFNTKRSKKLEKIEPFNFQYNNFDISLGTRFCIISYSTLISFFIEIITLVDTSNPRITPIMIDRVPIFKTRNKYLLPNMQDLIIKELELTFPKTNKIVTYSSIDNTSTFFYKRIDNKFIKFSGDQFLINKVPFIKFNNEIIIPQETNYIEFALENIETPFTYNINAKLYNKNEKYSEFLKYIDSVGSIINIAIVTNSIKELLNKKIKKTFKLNFIITN